MNKIVAEIIERSLRDKANKPKLSRTEEILELTNYMPEDWLCDYGPELDTLEALTEEEYKELLEDVKNAVGDFEGRAEDALDRWRDEEYERYQDLRDAMDNL